MAEIRCPMCGKTNPEGQDDCQYCQARLTPLSAKPFPTDSLDPEDEEGGLPNWLTAVRESSEPASESTFTADDADDSADWLNRLETDPEPEADPGSEPIAPRETASASEGDSDWLQRIRTLRDQDEAAEQVGQPPSTFQDETNQDADGNEIPDWLDDFHAERGSTPSTQPSQAEPVEAAADDLPDWFDDIEAQVDGEPGSDDQLPSWMSGAAPAAEAEPEGTAPSTEAEVPDWLTELTSEETPVQTAPESADDLPDSLSGEDQNSVDEPALAAVEPSDETEIPDWLSTLGSEEDPAETSSTETDDIPAWLSGAEDETLATPVEEKPEPAAEADLPDLFSGTEPEPAAEAEVPDWLTSLDPTEEPAETEPTESAELPDWMATAASTESAADEKPEQAVEAEIPDWLSGELETETDTDQEEAPDWLSELPGDEAEEALPEPISMGLGDDSEALDWLSEEGLDFEIPDSAALEPEATLNLEEGEDLPNWLENIGPGQGVPVEAEYLGETIETTSPFDIEDEPDDDLLDIDGLPDWLSSDSESVSSPQEPGDDENLAPVELPGWLEAMRPAEADVAEGADDGFVESAGPLAGLKSVLAAEPDVSLIQVSPSYSVKLEVEKDQRKHAKLFEELLASEGEASPVPRPIMLSTQRVLRWLIAFVLIIFVGFTIISESQNVPLPAAISIPNQTIAANKLVNAVPDGAPVLLAFDYEPGMAGEMHAAAAAVIDRLIVKGTRFALVSTLPSGPAIAEYFFHNVQERAYQSGKDYVNLGYIPGGTTGLLSFAHTPQLVFPMSYDGNREPWSTPPLQNVTRVADFALVIIITADPDVARAWIEQVQPQMGTTPLITILSAQAEPMVRPYYDDTDRAQVQGVISGLSGAAAYEVNADESLGREYWDAYSVGLIIAVAAILIGGTINIISVLLNRKPSDQDKTA